MGFRTKIRGLVLLFALAVIVTAGIALLAAPPAEAARCCGKVMYCTVTPPIVCWEVCLPCR